MTSDPIVGLVPMAGQATRLAPLPGSKELLPLGFETRSDGSRFPKVVSRYLLETFQAAGIQKVIMVLREGKWDIARYYGNGVPIGLELAYMVAKTTHGVPFTLDSAYAFSRNSTVAVGFPDIVYEPKDAFVNLRDKLVSANADLVLGLFPASAPQRSDMVEVDAAGGVRTILSKPSQTELTLSWGLALWSPAFSDFMHTHLATLEPPNTGEIHLSSIFLAAMAAGLKAATVTFAEGGYWDIGTAQGFKLALERFGR